MEIMVTPKVLLIIWAAIPHRGGVDNIPFDSMAACEANRPAITATIQSMAETMLGGTVLSRCVALKTVED